MLTVIIILAGADGPWLIRLKLEISVLIKTGLVTKLLQWQQYNRCHFVSFVMNISGVKFEEHCSNISRDILFSVFLPFLAANMMVSLSQLA